MTKKLSALSQPARLIQVTSEDIKNRQWTDAERQAVRRAAKSQAAGDDSDIDITDIPRLSEAQLANMIRLRDVRRKVAVSVRLDPQVLN